MGLNPNTKIANRLTDLKGKPMFIAVLPQPPRPRVLYRPRPIFPAPTVPGSASGGFGWPLRAGHGRAAAQAAVLRRSWRAEPMWWTEVQAVRFLRPVRPTPAHRCPYR